MRAIRLRSALLKRGGSGTSTRPTTASASVALVHAQSQPSASSALLQLHRALFVNNINNHARSFSVTTKFPTQDESAILAHADDEHDPNCSQLVCGSCNTPISQTNDLIFFKWKNGIHLSSTTDAPLRSLCSQDNWEDDADVSWKKHKLHCLKCGNHVGTMAKVFASDKILFSAKQVAIQMPANQSPLISISGYPSSQLGFSYWTELILMLESQPSLKDALQIRRVDQIREFNKQRKQLNTKLLMAKDLPTLLRIVDEHASEMNDVNILTAVVRVARFSANQTPRKNRVSVMPRLNLLTKSEAPEDQLLDISSHIMARPRSAKEIALEKERFWKLVQLVESLVNFSISALKEGHELANFMKSIWQLGIGRPSILEPIAKQVLFVLNSETEVHDINEHEASIIATSIVHLSSKEVREQPWVKQLLHAAANRLVEESTRKGKTSNFDILIPLVRAFVIAGEFHEELFALLFAEVRKDRLDQADYMSSFKIRNLKSKMYQVHLDCVLNGYSKDLRLKPAQVEEFKEIFQSHQVQVKSSSFRLQHLVSTALDEMGVEHTRSLALDEGYCLDIALKHKIAIEINDAECYQVLEDHEPESEADKKDFIIATSMDEKPFGFVDLKARHLEELGWVVIQLRADKYQKLSSVEDRVRYLSMLLEVANNARRQQHQSELASSSSLD